MEMLFVGGFLCQGRGDVGAESLPLNRKRFSGNLGEGVSEAVTEFQLCRRPASLDEVPMASSAIQPCPSMAGSIRGSATRSRLSKGRLETLSLGVKTPDHIGRRSRGLLRGSAVVRRAGAGLVCASGSAETGGERGVRADGPAQRSLGSL